MKSIVSSALLAIALLTSGCTSVPPEALNQARDNALICDGFVTLMQEGKTNREQEQAFILANRRAWHAQNFAVNGTTLPEDLDPAVRSDANLLEILRADPRVRAKIQEIEQAIQPTPPSGSGQ